MTEAADNFRAFSSLSGLAEPRECLVSDNVLTGESRWLRISSISFFFTVKSKPSSKAGQCAPADDMRCNFYIRD